MTTLLLAAMLSWPLCGDPAGQRSALEERLRDLRSDITAVRAHAAAALGTIGDPAAVPALMKALGDPDPAVRRKAARALGVLRDRRAVASLVKALGDRDTTLRLNAAYALGEIKEREARPALLRALGDTEYPVRDQAAWALRELRDPTLVAPLVERLQTSGGDAAQVVWILRGIEAARVAKAFAALLDVPDVTLRRRGVRALVALRDPAAVTPLIAALADDDLDVRRTAVGALRATRDDRILAAFKTAAARESDPALRATLAHAVETLSRDPRLVAHWSFDDGDGRVARDVTGGGTDGQIIGCRSVKGRVGRALRFAPQCYVELGKPAAHSVQGKPMTVTAWVKTKTDTGVVVARGGAFCGYSLYIKDGVAKFGIHREQEGPGTIAAGRERVVGSWVHLAGVIEKDRIRLHVNGKLAAETPSAGFLTSECGQGMEIGFDVGNSAAEISDALQGVIDEVKVYKVALSAEAIAREARMEKAKATP